MEYSMTLIIPNQMFEYKGKTYNTGMKYDVSDSCANAMLKQGKGKVLKGSSPVTIKTAIPKVSNRDPVIEEE